MSISTVIRLASGLSAFAVFLPTGLFCPSPCWLFDLFPGCVFCFFGWFFGLAPLLLSTRAPCCSPLWGVCVPLSVSGVAGGWAPVAAVPVWRCVAAIGRGGGAGHLRVGGRAAHLLLGLGGSEVAFAIIQGVLACLLSAVPAPFGDGELERRDTYEFMPLYLFPASCLYL